MTLSHLLLTICLACLLSVPLTWLERLVGLSIPFERCVWISVVPATMAALVVAWPFARLLGMPPLMIFAGPCPACSRRPPGWWCVESNPDQVQLACGACGARVSLYLRSVKSSDTLSSEMPTFVLRWPQFLGIWRRVGPKDRHRVSSR
jgi:hypothetical protein